MYLIASRAGILTGRRLARNLGLRFETNIEKVQKASEVIIRYGNAQLSERIIKDTDCNSRDSILKMSAKHRLWNFLKDTDIFSPRYYTLPEIDGNLTFPAFLRNKMHRAGRDIKVVQSSHEIPQNMEFIVPYYPTLREYRVHMAYGDVVKVMRKYPVNNNANEMIRTSAFGWQYKVSDLKQIRCAKSMIEIAKQVTEILDAKFCGIDMAWSSKDHGLNRWIVWEVNSAPSLNSSSLELYTEIFRSNLTERLQKNVLHKSSKNYGRSAPYNRLNKKRR
jgi:hypothetical protein